MTADDATATACYGRTTDCCLSPTIIMGHFWKSSKGGCAQWRRKKLTLDLTGCKYLGGIHQRIKKAFDFPDFYGENWDAFWDLLWSECDADKVVIIRGNRVSKELMPSIEIINEILQELKEDRKKYGEQIEIEIHD